MGRRRYCTGINRLDDTITAWMITLSIPVDMNMPMNLMDVGIMDAHPVSSRDREALHVQGKNIQQHYTETIKKQEQL